MAPPQQDPIQAPSSRSKPLTFHGQDQWRALFPNPRTRMKRKRDLEPLVEGEGEREQKHQKLEMASVLHLLLPAVDEGTGALTSVDKGKGIVVEEEEGDKEADDDDSDDGSDVGSEDESGGEGDDDSDFVDDPLVEVDPENILPSSTQRREPPRPGVYVDPDQDEDDSGDSE
nr:PREDICTED: uncharacterized protein LOC103968584 [Musa acuminata subsp. malaccensis]XP_018675281.1 PREDICTED: uncharacterized protein LOC103968584 [Musa acuminata subsp. malaccensis]